MMTAKAKAKLDDPLCPGEWIVEIKVLKRIRVGALDELDAENEAVKLLSEKDRAAATDVRIAAGRYEDGTPLKTNDEWYAPMHQAE